MTITGYYYTKKYIDYQYRFYVLAKVHYKMSDHDTLVCICYDEPTAQLLQKLLNKHLAQTNGNHDVNS